MLLSLRLPRLVPGSPLPYFRQARRRAGEIHKAMQGRRALATMSPRMLADIGLSPGEAEEEINRKPWDTAPRRV